MSSTVDALRVLGSEEAQYHLLQYARSLPSAEYTDRELDHPRAVASIVESFAGDMIPEPAYDAALLHDVVDRLENPGKKYSSHVERAAKAALNGYFEAVDPVRAHYVSALLADLPLIEKVAEGYRFDPRIRKVNSAFDRVVEPGYDGEVSPRLWRMPTPSPNIAAMEKVATTTNIESFIVRGSESIHGLWVPPKRPAALFLDAHEAQYFTIPMLEIDGLDGQAMTLRDIALKHKFDALADVDESYAQAVRMSEQVYEDAQNINIKKLLDLVVGPGKSRLTHAVKENDLLPHYPIGDYEFENPVGANSRKGIAKFRVKTPRSLADKIRRYDGLVPMDVFAATVIEPTVADSAAMFATLANILTASPDAELKPARSKDHAIYVQGGDAYREAVRRALEDQGVDLSQVQFSPGEYEVSKITFNLMHDGVATPSEIQFVTEAIRHQARLGSLAHWALKAQKRSEFDPSSLENIYDRKSHMTADPADPNYMKVNPHSEARAIALRERVAA